MRYDTGNWIPESNVEKLMLQKQNAEEKIVISPIKKKCIKVPVIEYPTPLSIGYIILKNGMFIEVPRNQYHLLFFQKFIEFYTGEKMTFETEMDAITYFNNELQFGIYMIDYGMGDGSHSLNKGYVYLPSEKWNNRFSEAIHQYDYDSQELGFTIVYIRNGEVYYNLDDSLLQKRKK